VGLSSQFNAAATAELAHAMQKEAAAIGEMMGR